MQPLPEPLNEVVVTAEEAYASLVTYNGAVKQAEEAVDTQNPEVALSHLMLAANCASNVLAWASVQKAFSSFAHVTGKTLRSIKLDFGGGEPPFDKIITLLEEWLKSSWAAKLTKIAGRVAAALGAESYQIQAGFPAGVSITITFPAAKSQSGAKRVTRHRRGRKDREASGKHQVDYPFAPGQVVAYFE